MRRLHRLRHLVTPHAHDPATRIDDAAEQSAAGIRAVKISLVLLLMTFVAQAGVVVLSGSVALLGDTLHNLADALTAVPLWIAFVLARRRPTRRYTYGYGRAEDLAGVFVVVVIAASAAAAAYESIDRLVHPSPVGHLGLVGIAAALGFVGNEVVAQYRVRVGRRIGSAALVADGLHARVDGLTSLAVLVGAGLVAAGFPRADPIVGLAISVAILFVLKDAVRQSFSRIMDGVDPEIVTHAEAALHLVGGIEAVTELRIRWIGHRMRAELTISVSEELSAVAAHALSVDAEHALLHAVPRLDAVNVHVNPAPSTAAHHHGALAHHHASRCHDASA